MKRILIAAAAALALSACATATPYQPAQPGVASARGYSEQRVEDGRWRVSFAGNSVTARDTVEMYLLYRAAELTTQNGFDWFETVNRGTQTQTSYYSTPDPWWGSGYGPYWRPYWRVYRGGWSRWGPWGPDFEVQEISQYQADAEIVMHHGAKQGGDPRAFDAREVMSNLGPRIVRPQAQPQPAKM